MIVHIVLSFGSEQTSITQASASLEDRNTSGSDRRGLTGNDLLWRKPKLFVSPYSGEEEGACLLVCLLVFVFAHTPPAVCRATMLQVCEA